MIFRLRLDDDAAKTLQELQHNHSKKRILKDVLKTLEFMKTNLRHPSLNTHEYHSFKGPNGEKFLNPTPNKKLPEHIEFFSIMDQNRDGSQFD